MRRVHIKLMFALAGAIVLAAGVAATLSQATLQSEPKQQSVPAASQDQASPSTATLELPITFQRRVGDLDGMAKRHEIRALVVPSRTGFFYDKGRARGAMAELMDAFEIVINKKLKTGAKKFKVVFLPMPPGLRGSSRLSGPRSRPIDASGSLAI